MTSRTPPKARSLCRTQCWSDDSDVMVRVGHFLHMADVLRTLGHDPKPIFAQAGFQLEQFADPDLRVPYHRASHLLAVAQEVSGCEHLGLLLGQKAHPSQLGVTGFLAHAAPTVAEAVRALVEHLDLHDEGGTLNFTVGERMTLLGYSVNFPEVEAIDLIQDMSTAACCSLMRGLCGESWRPAEVLLARRKPDDCAPYHRYFRAPLMFDADQSAIVFANHWLETPLPTADRFLFRHLEREAEELHHLQHRDLIDALPAELRRALLERDCTASGIASRFGLHERTLHRRLSAAGTSYRKELDKVRFTLGQQLLESTDLSIAQITETVGYTSSSAFVRAFKRVSGTTPSGWRRGHLKRQSATNGR